MNNMQVTVDGMSGTIQQDGMVRFGSDDRMNVLFYDKVVIDPVKSREMGRPFSNSVPYVRIQQPGERDYVDRPIRENDDAIRRWPRHYEAYKQGRKPAHFLAREQLFDLMPFRLGERPESPAQRKDRLLILEALGRQRFPRSGSRLPGHPADRSWLLESAFRIESGLERLFIARHDLFEHLGRGHARKVGTARG